MSQYTQNNGLDGIKIDFGNVLNFFSGNRYKWILVIVAVILTLVILSVLRGIYTDLIWFGELSYRSVYVKILMTKILLFIIGFTVFAITCAASLYVAFRWSTGEYVAAVPLQTKKFLSKDQMKFNKHRAIADYISGMTDRYAINLYENTK